jgi:hypothetical protein
LVGVGAVVVVRILFCDLVAVTAATTVLGQFVRQLFKPSMRVHPLTVEGAADVRV